MRGELVKLSKQLSKILRHQPERWGLALEPGGWVKVDDLIRAARAIGVVLDRSRLHELIQSQPKPRFAFSPDGSRIRANYGHSIDIDLQLEPVKPPPNLHHGSASHQIESIRIHGLQARGRRFVHLSEDPETAWITGQRHGKPVVFKVNAVQAHSKGTTFYYAAPGIWLSAFIPPDYVHLE